MICPTKITLSGNAEAGKTLIGRAHKEMMILENLMSFQDLKQDARTVFIDENTVIECWKGFGRRIINIYVKPTEPVPGGFSYLECFCDSCFAIGKITNVYEPNEEHDCYYYDVDVCHGQDTSYSYVLFEGIIAVDYGVYEEGQLVMLANMIENDTDYCCPQDTDVDMCSVVVNDEFPVIVPICLSSGESYAMWERKRVNIY